MGRRQNTILDNNNFTISTLVKQNSYFTIYKNYFIYERRSIKITKDIKHVENLRNETEIAMSLQRKVP